MGHIQVLHVLLCGASGGEIVFCWFDFDMGGGIYAKQ